MTINLPTEESRWFNPDADEALEKFSFEDEKHIGCKLSKIYYYSRIRNAYWRTTSNIYPGDHAFHFDLGVIKNRIERDRTRGTRFVIHEIPCLALIGKDDSIVIMKNSAESLKPFYGPAFKDDFSVNGLNIKEIYEGFKPLLNIYGFVMDSKNVPDFNSPIYRYSSNVVGSSYRLGYSKARKDVDITRLLLAFNLVHQLLRK